MENKKSIFEKISSTAESVKSAANSVGITAENLKSVADKIGESAKDIGDKTSKVVSEAGKVVVEAGTATVEKVKEIDWDKYQVDVEDILRQLMKIPGLKVDRQQFLRKELIPYFPENIVHKAIDRNPAYAGIARDKIDEMAKTVIKYETNKVSAISFVAGMPGGLTMVATIPADITQYFGNVIIAMQKLAYLYGFADFGLNSENINDDALNELMLFLGVMFGVQGASVGVKFVADSATKQVVKTLSNKALTKTTIYPIVKKVAKSVGIKVTKDIFAKSVSKAVPVIGGVVSGGMTYAMFKPGCRRLQKNFRELNLSNPDFYKDIIDIEE